MTNVETLFEEFAKLSELDQTDFLERVCDFHDKWKLNHVHENALGFNERLEEAQQVEVNLTSSLEEVDAENKELTRENKLLTSRIEGLADKVKEFLLQ